MIPTNLRAHSSSIRNDLGTVRLDGCVEWALDEAFGPLAVIVAIALLESGGILASLSEHSASRLGPVDSGILHA